MLKGLIGHCAESTGECQGHSSLCIEKSLKVGMRELAAQGPVVVFLVSQWRLEPKWWELINSGCLEIRATIALIVIRCGI